MAPLPEPHVDDEVREKLKSAMEQTGAPAELADAVSAAEVDSEPEQAGDHGRHDHRRGIGITRRRRTR
jgi:plasmid stability protein